MRETFWYACSKCDEVDTYQTWNDGQGNDFPVGEFYAHRDFMVTGLKSREEAMEWLTWLKLPEPRPPTPNMRKQEAEE